MAAFGRGHQMVHRLAGGARVNLFIPHAFYYSIRGKRKDERPPDVGPHSIWWTHYEAWSTYWRRLSWLMTDIDLHAEVAVLCRNRDLCPDTVRPLFERQIGFQYIPESYFPACTVEDGALWLHGHRYTAVLGDKALFPDAAHPVQLPTLAPQKNRPSSTLPFTASMSAWVMQ